MKVSALPRDQAGALLKGPGLSFQTGEFLVRLRSPVAEVAEGVQLLYADYPLVEDGFADFHLAVVPPRTLRRWYRRQVVFKFDERVPFKPLPYDQALPLVEWGLNWCIANHAHRFLMVHAAAVEKNGRAVILPGQIGAGKSTLSAGLVSRGWRLLSDEFALIEMKTGCLVPLARPISLKNESIDVLRRFSPGATMSRPVVDTIKGMVALLKAPTESVSRMIERADPAWVILPTYEPGSGVRLEPNSKARTFMALAQNAFNYSIHGVAGFQCLADLVDKCDCYRFVYSDLEEAVEAFNGLNAPGPAASA